MCYSSVMPARITITYPAYLRLSALLRQARQYHRDLDRIDAAARDILGGAATGRFTDLAQAESDLCAGVLLRRLGVAVAAPDRPADPLRPT
jgi:hypothetical protein